MEVRNTFAIPADPDAAWALLLDVERVIPCMPGAELVETVSETEWKARLKTKLGPVSLGFDADIVRTEVDADARSVTLTAVARERSGRGGAQATIVNRLEADGDATVAHITTDLSLTGAVARFGRQSLISDVAAQMTGQFASNLQRELTGVSEPVASTATRAAAGQAYGGAPVSAPAHHGATAPEPSALRMIAGIALRSLIRRLERMVERVENPGANA